MLAGGVFLPVLQANPFNPFVAAALMLSLVAIILYYLLSRALSSPQLEAFTREEFSQFIFTALLFAAFVALAAAISAIASAAACGGAGCDHIDLALYSLGIVQNGLASTYFRLYAHEFVIGILSTIGFNIPVSLPPAFIVWVSLSPFSGLELLSNALVTVIESVGYLYALAYGRETLVLFFRDITYTVLLPAGFIMRTMPFSRRTGSSLIAIAFAGYFAYPLSILLSHYMIFGKLMEAGGIAAVEAPSAPVFCEPPEGRDVAEMDRALADEWSGQLQELTERGEGGVLRRLISGGGGSLIGGIRDFFLAFFGAVFTRYNFDLLSPNMSPFIHFSYFFMMDKIISLVQFAVLVLVTFVFEIIIAVTAFRSVSHVIGGEIEILGLTKVV
ncbi:MAG: hypothetical protein AB1657_01205 [Candidatus Micrarchaeota archaeon]